jgi:hypothetical protein
MVGKRACENQQSVEKDEQYRAREAMLMCRDGAVLVQCSQATRELAPRVALADALQMATQICRRSEIRTSRSDIFAGTKKEEECE